MAPPIVVANWKLHKTLDEARAYAAALIEASLDPAHCTVIIAPPATALSTLHQALGTSAVACAAQTIYEADTGAFTGAISAPLALDAGARYALVGHSERRRVFGENDATVARQVAACDRAGLGPIVCVGETLAEREAGHTHRVIDGQLRTALQDAPRPLPPGWMVAYEPVWAIGTGQVAEPAQVQAVHAHLRHTLIADGLQAQERVPLLYGGSVTPEHAPALMQQADIDGLLVGGASLDAIALLAIVRAAL